VSEIKTDHVLNRAGAMACGGCHQFSASKQIAANVAWPASLGFVHIDEGGILSPALLHAFLPGRLGSLKRAICGEFGVPTADPAAVALSIRDFETLSAQKNFLKIQMRSFGGTDDAAREKLFATGVLALDDLLRTQERNSPGAFRTVRPVH
jgi:hypothetical protein